MIMSSVSIPRNKSRKTRHRRIRGKVCGTGSRPRLNVFRSLNHIYAQVVSDEDGKVIAQADSRKTKGKDKASAVGKTVAEKCLKKKISKIVFDKGGYRYHGKVKALAEAARKAGLKF